jgi:hypothetical protein
MSLDSVREQLRRASEEIDSACEETTAADAEEYLTGIVRLLDYYADGDVTDPEAHIYPPPGALDTIQSRITDVIEETDDPAAEHLRNARTQLLEVILALHDRLNEGR